jgi:hypothetical protein
MPRVACQAPISGPNTWAVTLYLKRHRPDLDMLCLDAPDTGLVLVTNLDPDFHRSGWNYHEAVRTMMGWELHDIGLRALFAELDVQSTDTLLHHHQITARYWL